MLRLVSFILVFVFITNPIREFPFARPQLVENRPSDFQVRYHPESPLLAGDQISIQVFVPNSAIKPETRLKVEVVEPRFQTLGESTPQSQSAETSFFTLLWSWDTRGWDPGNYQLKYSLMPDGTSWDETVRLQSTAPGPAVQWQTREIDCCSLYYLSGSDAERDINELAVMIDRSASLVKERLHFDDDLPISNRRNRGGSTPEKPRINLIPRLLGQGGFTSDEITVTYADDNPAASDVGLIIQHELTHLLDNDLGGEYRPLMFMEGIAVYFTGGHYRPEPLLLRAAALLKDGSYIPLNILCEDFYSHQHETSYLQAAALVGYMVNFWGWDAFNQFYRDIRQKSGQSTADAISDGLERHFELNLQELDDRLAGWLETLPLIPDLMLDVQVTSDYFDAIRAYQAADDPSADFRQVWLPDPKEMRRRGITADYLRSPQTQDNQVITALLHKIGINWRAGLFPEAISDLQIVKSLLAVQ